MRALPVLLVLCVSSVQAIETAPPPVQREQVGHRISENIPPLPDELVERLARYRNTRGANLVGWDASGGLLVTTRFAETNQVHRVHAPLGMREQLTFLREPVMRPMMSPKGDAFVFGMDEGGSEFWQLYRYDLATRETSLLTSGGRTRNEWPLWSRDAQQLAWSSTARNGTDTDIWIRDMRSGASRAVVTEGGAWYASDFSPDGKRLLVVKRVSINEMYPGEVDLETGTLRLFPVDGGKAAFPAFLFAPDGRQVYYVSDEETEFLTLRHHDPAGGAPRLLSADIPWNVTQVALAPDGAHLAFVTNEDGIDRVHLRTVPDHRVVALPTLPIGSIANLEFSRDGRRLAFTLRSATAPQDVYALALDGSAPVQWTASEVGGLDPSGFIAPSLVRFPTFDEVDGKPRTIPAFYYRPPGAGPFPSVVMIHGGPEAQALPIFNPSIQFLLRELGVAVLVPNVRGSAGYGKTYLTLDNGMRREDSVRDIGALLDWIAAQPELDAERVGVYGGSYGGYMVLASMTHYNDRLRAGVDIVGISDFSTFLKNTQSYRRDLRRVEYGDERDPEMAAFYQRIAPLNNAHRISKPLFVAQGYNDPRVPYTEAEQIVSKVRGNGGDVWYLLFNDEGHGFGKKSNADYFDAAAMLFWRRHLLDE